MAKITEVVVPGSGGWEFAFGTSFATPEELCQGLLDRGRQATIDAQGRVIVGHWRTADDANVYYSPPTLR